MRSNGWTHEAVADVVRATQQNLELGFWVLGSGSTPSSLLYNPPLSRLQALMASSSRAMMKLPAASSIGFSTASRRSFAKSSQSFLSRAQPSPRALLDKSKLQQHFRRSYADVAPAKKHRRFRFVRYLWRATYLSAIAGTAYLAYGVWDLRHPDDQFEPDPNKKNLVILGKT